jgi:hypothetical protein
MFFFPKLLPFHPNRTMALQDSWDLQSRATDVDFPEDLLVPAKPWPSSMIYQLKNCEQKWFIYL